MVDPLLVSEGFGIGPGWAGPEHEVVVPAGFGSEDLRSELPRAEALLTAHAPVTEAMLELAPALRLVAKPGAGVDNIDVPAATRRGVLVTNVPGARGRAVAEHALFLVLSLARRAWMRDDAAWRDALAVQLGGKTLGIVGLGDIGSHLARFGHGLGMTVVAYTRTPDPGRVPDVPVRFVGAEELLREADVVVLCVPLSERTRATDRPLRARLDEGGRPAGERRARTCGRDRRPRRGDARRAPRRRRPRRRRPGAAATLPPLARDPERAALPSQCRSHDRIAGGGARADAGERP